MFLWGCSPGIEKKEGAVFFEATGDPVRKEHKFGSDGTTAKWMTTQWIGTLRE